MNNIYRYTMPLADFPDGQYVEQIAENEKCTKVLLGTRMHTVRGETTRLLVSVFTVISSISGV